MKKTIAAVCLLASSAAHAFTGNNLYNLMNDGDSASGLATAAYIRGFLDGAYFYQFTYRMQDGKSRDGRYFCMPEGATVEQAKDIVRNELAAQVAHRHLDAGILTMGALSRAWPCR